ncbi:MAG: ABC transporter substrate-binding protein, partial [Methanospirillum sp.]|nr:ABC transporter substrate-binding protein [Methanospirillum sp.]
TQDQARKPAENLEITLLGLGGTNGGIISALAGAALAASGMDGRYLEIGGIRRGSGSMEVSDILKTGIEEVFTRDGRKVTEGVVQFRKFPQPVRIFGRPVLLVDEAEDHFQAVKRD